MLDERWRRLAATQGGLLTRTQLAGFGVDSDMVRHRISSERWAERSETVISTTTGVLTREQLMWLGVLHAHGHGVVGDLTAAELAGLRNWNRDVITILVPRGTEVGDPIAGIRFAETRRPIQRWIRPDLALPVARIEPAILHFAAYQPSKRTAQGVLAAAIQQQLTTPEHLVEEILQMRPLRWAKLMKRALGEIAGGAQSVAELDVRRMCRAFRLAPPARQVKRRDSSGRIRFTDCEWSLADGRTLVLEVDGAFHMEVEQWEDDIARQRALTDPSRIIVRCTSRELRDDPGRVARDLLNLGVPRAA
ncbi:hypothetical protein GCM10028772_39480 [Nocardioides ultimimeridianus]